jgi:hypothetical protein
MDRLEKVMRVQSEIRRGFNGEPRSFMYKCLACGEKWTPPPLSGTNDIKLMCGTNKGEFLLQMICPNDCNKPEGYDDLDERLWVEWPEAHEADFQKFLARKKEANGVGGSKEALEEYEATIRDEWESSALTDRFAAVERGLAKWLEKKMLNWFHRKFL